MIDKEFQLRWQRDMQRLQNYLAELVLDPEKPKTVAIYHHDDRRTRAQDGLYFTHVGEVATWRLKYDNDEGMTYDEMKDWVHDYLKVKYLHPILMLSGTKKAQDYRGMWESLDFVEKNHPEQLAKENAKKFKHDILSITCAGKRDMRKFIDAYWIPMNNKGITLTDPKDMTDDED